MVLILVDGQSSVADLIRKIGNLQLTENALEELVRDGLIELKEDSLWADTEQVAHEIRSSAARRPMRPSPAREYQNFRPATDSNPPEEAGFGGANRPVTELPSDIKDDLAFPASRFSLLPDPSSAMQAPAPRTGLMTRLKSTLSGAGRTDEDEPVKLKPIRRGKTRNWSALIFSCLVGALVLGVAWALLFPLDFLVPKLEMALSAATSRPVRIGEVRIRAYPEPGLVLGNVEIGQGAGVIRIGELKLQPDPATLFSGRRSLRRVVLSGLNLPLERVGEIPAIFSALADPSRSPKIGAILLRNTDVSFSGLVLQEAEAEIQRDAQGRMQALLVRSQDRSLNLTAKPAAGAVDRMVEGFSWRPGEVSKFVADSVSFTGRLSKDMLMISGLEIRIFDGLVKGDAIVRAGGAMPNLSGSVTFERIDLSRLEDAMAIGKRLTGAIAGKMRYTANAETWPAIFSSVDGDGDFTIQRGNLYGIDLAEAARRGTPVQGGLTAFEQMSGQIRLTQNGIQLRGLSLGSGLMRTTGQVDIARTGELAGRLELQMMGSVNQTHLPVTLSGTLDAPTARAMGRQ
jgi:hypothetical protein